MASVIQKPNAEKTYSFTQETLSECLAHACGVLEATLLREDRLHQDSQTHDRFLQSKMKGMGCDGSTLFKTERGLRNSLY